MKDQTNESNQNGKGRPSKSEQLQIERRLRPLFMRGLSTYSASIESGYSVNTVKKYYYNFYNEIRDLESPEFEQACKDRKTSAYLAIDAQIQKMEKLQKELDLKPQTGEVNNIQQCKVKISLCQLISDLIIKRLNIANSPTSDEILVALRKVDEQK